ncbi:SAM-dependent methyltransferase [Saccharothrix sp. NRRL B-16348]|uniref:SAM-dependent methyltransferase n=1 Tax=Saccharothrix sp. NRRL B-16348 TaxID=1415542 RepID=UPI0018D000B4|nr:SAM-dependent methyltransferase [Saccharothrix sp. NRRL B-16348]
MSVGSVGAGFDHGAGERGLLAAPHPARATDYLLGGGYNFPADRELARRWSTVDPDAERTARAGRSFLARAVRHLVAAGVRGLVDLSTAVTAGGAPHQVVDDNRLHARTVYVQSDPVLLALGRMLVPEPHAVMEAPVGAPAAAWNVALTAGVLTPAEPVALLAVGLADLVASREELCDVLAVWRAVVPAGSWLVLTHRFDTAVVPGAGPGEELAVLVGDAGWTSCEPVVRAPYWRPLWPFDIDGIPPAAPVCVATF